MSNTIECDGKECRETSGAEGDTREEGWAVVSSRVNYKSEGNIIFQPPFATTVDLCPSCFKKTGLAE